MTRARRVPAAVALPALLLTALLAVGGCQDAPAAPGTSASRASDPAVTAPAEPGAATTRAAGSSDGPGDRSSDRPRDRAGDGSGRSAPPVADPSHAVDPPGRLTAPQLPADILIYSQDPLSDTTVSRIKHLRGVVGVESMAMAQVSLENTVINVAAVDPATYRRFTPSQSAQLQEQWTRVAGGEVSVLPELAKKLPTDAQGYLRLGNSRDAPRAHVGAYAPQIPQVDAVVNQSWIETLGMKAGNALIISTGITSPQSLRKPVERLAGADASVQEMDAVARYGLDTSVQQTAFLVGGVADAVGTFNYTVLGGGRVAPDPSWVSAHIATQQVPILGTVTCNKMIFPQLTAALTEITERGLADEIHPGEYAGCYYPRFIAGTTSLSNHSFGLALDLNTPGNQRGTVGEMDRGVVDVFKKWGFAWGGDWQFTDPMHFEMDAVVEPR
jgi:hypothetical protein